MKKTTKIFAITTAILVSFGMASPSKDVAENVKSHKSSVHRTHAYVKPSAGIALHYEAPKVLQVGESIELVLDFKARVTAQTLHVSFQHDSGVQLNTTQLEYQFDVLKNQSNVVTLALTALQNGRYFIDVMATLDSEGRAQSKAFSIPLVVGDPTTHSSINDNLAKQGYKVLNSESVVSMPATETTE